MKRSLLALTACAAMAVPAPAGAAGNPSVAIVDVAGTIYPGIGELPAQHILDFRGRATFVHAATGIAHVESCQFLGATLFDSKTEGLGTFTATCDSIFLPTCIYVRVALAMPVVCMNASPVAVWAGTLVMVPLGSGVADRGPWTQAALIGELTYGSQDAPGASRAMAGTLTGSGTYAPYGGSYPRYWSFGGAMNGAGTSGPDRLDCSFNAQQPASGTSYGSATCSGVSGYFSSDDCAYSLGYVIQVQCTGATNITAAAAVTFSPLTGGNSFTYAGAAAVTSST